MKLAHLSIETGVMRDGMSLRDFFQEAVRCNVPGLPYVDDQDQIIGRVSIRDVYKRVAVPDNLLRLADAMGDSVDNLDLPDMKVLEIFARPARDFILTGLPSVSPSSPIVKALALMEVHNSSYIFLIDNGEYKGVVTRMVIAKRMLTCVQELEQTGETPAP